MNFIRKNRLKLMMLILVVILTIIYFNYIWDDTSHINIHIHYSRKLSNKWYRDNCVTNVNSFKLEDLPTLLNKFETSNENICREIAERFYDIFDIEEAIGEIKIPSGYEIKIANWLNNDPDSVSQASKQKIVKLYNKFIFEEMIYNPLRGKRPQSKSGVSEKNFTFNLIESSKHNCDFCENSYQKNTAYDTFGRIETKYTYTAANTFKYDKWHSLIVSRNHNTLNLTMSEFVDMFNVSLAWFNKVNELDPSAIYPQMIWDAMPKSGASQVHTHLQCSMGTESYYGYMERQEQAFASYYKQFARYYIDDFILVHQALGLALSIDETYVIVNLVPVKDYEVMIVNTNQNKKNHFFKVLHYVIRAFVDDFEKYSFSMGMYFPKFGRNEEKAHWSFFGNNEEENSELKYSFCRIVFRGPATNLMSDMNGLDIYTNSVLGVDRYKIANKLFPFLARIFGI